MTKEINTDAELIGRLLTTRPTPAECLVSAARIEQLTAERDRLREALTFYADPETYQDTFVAEDCECCHRREHPAIEDDNGKVARAALKGESHD